MPNLTFCAISAACAPGPTTRRPCARPRSLPREGVVIAEEGHRRHTALQRRPEGGRFPGRVLRLQHAIAAADAVLIATPEYNYSVPGVLKNAIDWVSRTEPQPFANKPVAILGASPGALGTGRAQYDLRKMFVYLDAHLLNKPEVMISAAHTRFDAEGKLTDEATRKFLVSLLTALRDWTRRLQASA